MPVGFEYPQYICIRFAQTGSDLTPAHSSNICAYQYTSSNRSCSARTGSRYFSLPHRHKLLNVDFALASLRCPFLTWSTRPPPLSRTRCKVKSECRYTSHELYILVSGIQRTRMSHRQKHARTYNT